MKTLKNLWDINLFFTFLSTCRKISTKMNCKGIEIPLQYIYYIYETNLINLYTRRMMKICYWFFCKYVIKYWLNLKLTIYTVRKWPGSLSLCFYRWVCNIFIKIIFSYWIFLKIFFRIVEKSVFCNCTVFRLLIIFYC